MSGDAAYEPVTWLGRSSLKDVFPQNEKIQYELKRPLLAASSSFESRRDSDSWTCELIARAKVPLFWSGEFHATSSGRLDVLAPVRFSSYREDLQLGHKVLSWSAGSAGLVCEARGDRRLVLSLDALEALPAPVVSPLLLQTELRIVLNRDQNTYGGFSVFGESVLAFRFDVNSQVENLISVRSCRISQGVNERQWHELPWETKQSADLYWDSERGCVTEIRARHKATGDLRFPLVFFERG